MYSSERCVRFSSTEGLYPIFFIPDHGLYHVGEVKEYYDNRNLLSKVHWGPDEYPRRIHPTEYEQPTELIVDEIFQKPKIIIHDIFSWSHIHIASFELNTNLLTVLFHPPCCSEVMNRYKRSDTLAARVFETGAHVR